MQTSILAIDIDFRQGWNDAWSAIATFVPKFIGFLAILFIGWIVAKAIAAIVRRVLDRVGFEKLVDRGGIKNMMARSNWTASQMLAKLAYYAVLLITLQLGFGVWGPNPVSDMLNGIVSWLPKLAVAIVIVIVAAAIARVVHEMVSAALGGLSYGALLARVASVFIWALGIIAALNQVGVATAVTEPVLWAVLLTVAGVLIVGVGGGLVRPMQSRWDGWLDKVEGEMPALRGHTEAYKRGREDVSRQQAWQDQSATTTTRYTSATGAEPGDRTPRMG
ncbi:mechanosensitive ion channel family protein [Nocardia goodfellowii]|uniref:Transporter (Transmembrane protein) n=1 Tax=Nocardia goodfellowii TaxID=882446 RepID=A0ABS4QBT1_9NOCA|nr:hypothetical protein [Nocardia goodfellowii]MBP2189153.1 hypothetical protein [Nocardia goodfellowii]